MSHRTPSFDRPRTRPQVTPVSACILGLVCLVVPLTPGAVRAQLAVGDVTPETVSPGGVVTIEGEGFARTAGAHRVWIESARGGVLLEPTKARASRLDAVVGPVESSRSGRLHVWVGATRSVPEHTMELETRRGPNRSASLRCGQVFAPTARATGSAVSIEIEAEAPRVVTAQRVDDRLVLDLSTLRQVEPQASCCGGESNLCIGAVIETKGDGGSATDGGDGSGTEGSETDGSETDGSGTDDGGSGETDEGGDGGATGEGEGDGGGTTTGGIASRGSFGIDLAIDLGQTTPRRSAKLASIVADALEQQFGSFGLVATARGARVSVTVPGGIQAGTLRLEY